MPALGRSRGVAVAGLLLAAVASACGTWQRAGTDSGPDPSVLVPRLFDPTTVYAGMGFFAQGAPLPFVATIRFLATSSPDTALAVFGLSLANNALSFRRSPQAFEAEYRVEVTFLSGGRVIQRLASEETVRVASRDEARRADESIIFQQFGYLPVGAYQVVVTVRDQKGTAFSADERAVTVPRFAGHALSDLIPIYQGVPRGARDELPRLLVNPRATVPYGQDSLVFYVEGYGQAEGATVVVHAVSLNGDTAWVSRAPLAGGRDLATAIIAIAPESLPVGELRLWATVEATGDSAQAMALVSFSDRWVITNFDDILSLLRYFGEDQVIADMRAADPRDQAGLWREFWVETDPDPMTPENEALTQYFRRVEIANVRFREAGDPGWLTDRGEVYIGLGEPDEVLDQSSALQGQRRVIRWTYVRERLVLDFIDETGFGRFRITPSSRADFHRVVERVRRER